MDFKYTLEHGSKKHPCPACQKKRFVKYIDTETSQYIHDTVGRCDREQNCGYHVKPKEYLQDSGFNNSRPVESVKPEAPKVSFLPREMMQATLKEYEQNQLVYWLSGLPGWDMNRAVTVAKLYNIGTGTKAGVKHWPIYWQVDTSGRVRSGKLIKYNPETGKRIKDEPYCYDWIHSILQRKNRLDNFELVQCFFGLHLIKTDTSKPVAIVESEKTAIVASQYLPQMKWLATGQLNGLNEYKLKPLAGRKVVLFPDKGCFQNWKQKANEYKAITNISVSDLLEVKAPDEHSGYDLADYLIQYSIADFVNSGESGKSGTENKTIGKPPITELYPDEWNTVSIPNRYTASYSEMIRAEINDSDSPRPDLIGELNSLLNQKEK